MVMKIASGQRPIKEEMSVVTEVKFSRLQLGEHVIAHKDVSLRMGIPWTGLRQT